MAKTSATLIIAAGIVAGATAAASACDWHNKQVLASAPQPPAEEQTATTTSATPIDPVTLAEMRSADSKVEAQE